MKTKTEVNMKKILSMILALLFAFSTCASALEFDASRYTLEELADIIVAVEAELKNRIPDVTAVIYPGFYCAGRDIAPGTYVLKALQEKGPGGDQTYIKRYDKDDHQLDGRWLPKDAQYQLTLGEGEAFELIYAEAEIREAAPMLFSKQ